MFLRSGRGKVAQYRYLVATSSLATVLSGNSHTSNLVIERNVRSENITRKPVPSDSNSRDFLHDFHFISDSQAHAPGTS